MASSHEPGAAELPAPRGRKTRLRGDERQALIVGALAEELRRRSIHELRIEEIAARAGVTRATFYFYFESKYAVLAAAVQAVSDDYRLSYERIVRAAPGDGRPDLRAAATGIVRTYAEHGHLLSAFADAAGADDALRALHESHLSDCAAAAVDLIEAERVRVGAPSRPDSGLMAQYLARADDQFLRAAWRDGRLTRHKRRAIAETLAEIWHRAVYAEGLPGGRATASAPRAPRG